MIKAKSNTRLLGSSILLALTSSLCCIAPLLAIFGAAGGALSIFSWIAPLRPYLLGATVLVLALAFYRAYKPVKKDECGCDTRKGLMQSKAFLWIIAIISIGLSTFPYYEPYLQKEVKKHSASNRQNIQQTTFQIQGMSCAACEGHINSVLLQKKGIQTVTTSYAEATATIKFDSTEISTQQMADAIEKEAGYKVLNANEDVH